MLIELDALLEKNNQLYFKQIETPLEKNDIIKLLDKYELYRCEEFIDLYSWHGWVNGKNIYDGNYTEFCSLGCLVDLPSAFEKFLEDKKNTKYLENKLPIVIRDDGDYMAVDLKKQSLTRGSVFVCEPAITFSSEMVKIYDSIPLFIQSVNECYRQGVYTLRGNHLKVDYNKESDISSALNHDSPYWNE